MAARLRGEEGVIATLTVLFIILIASSCIGALWVVSYASGAHTTLYAAAQSAAYTAATEVDFASNANTSQFNFLCQSGYSSIESDPWCNAGRTFDAADQMLRGQLQGQFGLRFGSTIGSGGTTASYSDTSGNPASGIRAYQVETSAGVGQGAQGSGCVQTFNGSTNQARVCWQAPGEFGVTRTSFNSGVLVSVTAKLRFLPGCTIPVICDPVTLTASVPASQSQQSAPPGYR